MRPLSIRSLVQSTWEMCKPHWRVFLLLSLVPFVFTILQKFVVNSASFMGSVTATLVVVTGFLSYYFQTEYAIALSEGHKPHWRQLLRNCSLGHIWRVIRTNVWMVFIIVWPMFVLVIVAGVLGFVIGQDSFAGTTISLIAMGVAAIIGAIISFIRSLSYTLMLYLSFTTKSRVRTLAHTSKSYMRTNRIKFLKLVLLQILVGIVAALSIILLPFVQSFIYIIMVLFAKRVMEAKSHVRRDVVGETISE